MRSALASLGRALGFGVTIVDEVQNEDEKASSTAIRQALRAGEPELAAQILGQVWVADGPVIKGEQNGRKFGYPTANTSLGELIHPKYGVYAVRVRIDRAGEWLLQVSPILDARQPRVCAIRCWRRTSSTLMAIFTVGGWRFR